MPIDSRMVKWDDEPTASGPNIDQRMVKWDEQPAAAPMSRMEKIGKGAIDPIEGGAQLLTNILPSSVVNAGNSLNNWLADKTGLVARLPEGGMNQLVKQQEEQYQAKRAAAGETGFDGYRTLGNVLSPANVAVASRMPVAATLGGKVATGVAGGGLSALMNPVTGDDFWKEKGTQVAIGSALGGATPLAAAGVGRLISPNASKNVNLDLLKSEGVKPTIGQTLGGWANKAEEKMQSLPIVGDAIAAARGRSTSEFERAANNRALSPIGQKLPEGLTGREAVAYTEIALKDKYDEVLGNIGAINADPKFNKSLTSLTDMVNKLMIPKDDKLKFRAALNDVKSSIDSNGYITPDIYKSLESTLGRDAATLARSQAINDNKIAPAVKQLQAELKDLLQRQAGSSADELKAANTGWANFKRVQRAAASVGADDGQFTPAQFQSAVKALDRSKDKGAFARGNALGQDLGDAGKSMLTNKVPDSGTAGRLALGIGGLASGAINPLIPAGLVGGATMYTPFMQNLLRGAVSSRPQFAQPVAGLLNQASPLLIPAGAQIGLGLLN